MKGVILKDLHKKHLILFPALLLPLQLTWTELCPCASCPGLSAFNLFIYSDGISSRFFRKNATHLPGYTLIKIKIRTSNFVMMSTIHWHNILAENRNFWFKSSNSLPPHAQTWNWLAIPPMPSIHIPVYSAYNGDKRSAYSLMLKNVQYIFPSVK